MQSEDRRSFLGWLAGFLQAGIGLFLMIPAVRYVLHPALGSGATNEMWSDAGALSDVAVGEPQRKMLSITERDGWSQRVVEKTVWVIRNPDDTVRVFTAVCPHLGCTINWKTQSKNFNCACHESYFDLAGRPLSGPSPRPMDTLEYKVEGGLLYVKHQNFKQAVPAKEVLS